MIVKIYQLFVIFCLTIFTILLLMYLSQKPYFELKHPNEPAFFPSRNHLFDSISHKLLNISFEYMLNNEHLCANQSEEILAVFIVTSYFGNIETRSSMRRAFSVKDLKQYKLRRVFLLGEAPEDRYTTQKHIINENNRFKDIIQGNFSEAYRNLTYKHIMGLKWASTFCSNAKYIIKMDDDIVVNMYKLKYMLNSLESLKKDFIAGYILRNLKPIREPANKWYVTEKEYPLSNYPNFVSGWFYIINPNSARKIVALSTYEKYFWIDDVFVTGVLAKKLKIMLFDIKTFFTVNSEFLQCCLQDLEKNIDCDINVGPNGGDNNMFFAFNEKVKKCSLTKTCTRRIKPLNETCVAEKKVNLGKGNVVISEFRLV